MKRINLKYVMNMRDLGGYPVASGSYTAYGRILRSDVPSKLLDTEIDMLKEMGIGTVIDLRMDDECDKYPHGLKGIDGFCYHNFAMDAYALHLNDESDMPKLYMAMAGDKATMNNIFKTIAYAENGVLFHCMAGKDRTGLISALLLMLAGVDDSDILADYQLSYTYIRVFISKWDEDSEGVSWPAFINRSDIEYMESFLCMFREHYGDVFHYFAETGLSNDTVLRLKSKLL